MIHIQVCPMLELEKNHGHLQLNCHHQFHISLALPKRSFGKKNVVWHAFQAKWFDCHSWLHYDEGNDLVFCYLCMQALQEKKLMASKCVDEAVTSRGFSNWKDAKVAFTKQVS